MVHPLPRVVTLQGVPYPQVDNPPYPLFTEADQCVHWEIGVQLVRLC